MEKIVVLALSLMLGLAAPAQGKFSPESVNVVRADCPYYTDGGTCTVPQQNTIYLDPHSSRFDYWHEMGHVFDYQRMTVMARETFRRILNLDAPWTATTEAYEQSITVNAAGETFADAFAACKLGMSPRGRRLKNGIRQFKWTTGYDYNPSVRQHRRVCRLIAAVG